MSLVSVIMAVYNGEKYLAAAIESVLAQVYTPIELILVNDGSQDGSEEIINSYGSQVLSFYQPNQGQPAAQNRGLHLAKGQLIAFLDADDLYDPYKTTRQIQCLEAKPQLDAVFGYVEQFISPELPPETQKRWRCPQGALPGYLAAAGLFRKECFERVGLFNENQRIGSFIEWYMRGCEQGVKYELIQAQVLSRRIHENNIGTQVPDARQKYIEIVKEALKRRSHV